MTYTGHDIHVMMMIAFITINGGLVSLIESLCAQILYFRFEIIGGSLRVTNVYGPVILHVKCHIEVTIHM